MRRRDGFTLIELLISVALLGIVVIYLMQTFTVQHRTYTVVDQTTEAQQNLRALAELLERDLRHAGLMVPETAAVCLVDNTAIPDVLFLSDADAVTLQDDDREPDFGADLPPTVTTVGSGAQTLSVANLAIEPATPALRFDYDTDGDGVNDSDFRPGAGVIVTDRADPTRGAACGVVRAVAPTQIQVTILTAAVGGAGAQLTAVPAHVYQVQSPAAGRFQLVRDGVVIAEDVEDLQIAAVFDTNENGEAEAGEFRGDGLDPDYLANEAGLDESTLREVRASLVLRTRLPDPEHTQGVFQATENRVAPAGTDGYRRRVHTSKVRLRNLALRGA
jgi:prepilin-type N-terminal cleavage/methylation domain-containing protein